jgi:hypothetical protein
MLISAGDELGHMKSLRLLAQVEEPKESGKLDSRQRRGV